MTKGYWPTPEQTFAEKLLDSNYLRLDPDALVDLLSAVQTGHVSCRYAAKHIIKCGVYERDKT